MKKIIFLLIAFLMLAGCSQKNTVTTFMITKDNQLYALYNSKGEKLTDYNYKTFEKVSGIGYIVTNAENKKGLISFEGDEIIAAGMYETLTSADEMFFATKKIEKKTDSEEKVNYENYQYTNLYVLDKAGTVLYTASEDIGIKKSGLPLIYDKKTKEYTVLYRNGETLYKGTETAKYAYQGENNQSIVIGMKDNEKFYYFDEKDEKKNLELTFKEVGTYKILCQNEKGIVLNDSALKSMIYVDLENGKYYQNNIGITGASFDEMNNIILTAPHKVFVYPVGKVPVLMTSYYISAKTYIERSQVVYGPHNVYKEGVKTGELENCQFYPDAYHIYSEIFPVYEKEKGYVYYNFDCKKVIDKYYLEAHPFNSNSRAIVKEKEDGYSLIEVDGTVVTKQYYSDIKYIGSSYYAVYNESGIYGIIDSNGDEIVPMEYTSLPEEPFVTYNESTYLVLNKNGRGLVYDIKDDMKEIFSQEGNVVFNKDGYFQVGNQYYTFDGKLME